jgi:hypothetical protein
MASLRIKQYDGHGGAQAQAQAQAEGGSESILYGRHGWQAKA